MFRARASKAPMMPTPEMRVAAGQRWNVGMLEACRSGDREAMGALFEACAPRIHSVALHHFGGDHARADDVTQNVFLKLFTRLPQFRGEAELTTWLYRVAVNECLDVRRGLRGWLGLDAAAETRSRHRQDTALEGVELEGHVRVALAALPPKLRIAVLLRHFEGLSYEQMAEALGCSAGTVASRLHRGHAALARDLAWMREPEGSAS